MCKSYGQLQLQRNGSSSIDYMVANCHPQAGSTHSSNNSLITSRLSIIGGCLKLIHSSPGSQYVQISCALIEHVHVMGVSTVQCCTVCWGCVATKLCLVRRTPIRVTSAGGVPGGPPLGPPPWAGLIAALTVKILLL